jgi:pantoate kinase
LLNLEPRKNDAMNSTPPSTGPQPQMNPYLAGVLVASSFTLGVGLGASAGIARAGASAQSCLMPQHVAHRAQALEQRPDQELEPG